MILTNLILTICISSIFLSCSNYKDNDIIIYEDIIFDEITGCEYSVRIQYQLFNDTICLYNFNDTSCSKFMIKSKSRFYSRVDQSDSCFSDMKSIPTHWSMSVEKYNQEGVHLKFNNDVMDFASHHGYKSLKELKLIFDNEYKLVKINQWTYHRDYYKNHKDPFFFPKIRVDGCGCVSN